MSRMSLKVFVLAFIQVSFAGRITITSTITAATATLTSASGAAAASSSSSSSSSSTAPTGSNPPAPGGAAPITYDQFCQAAAAYAASGKGTPPKPSEEVYKQFVAEVCSKLSIEEAAYLMANCVWETGGLQFTEEIACKTGTCEYKNYFGRGYIQLTWDYNYKEAFADMKAEDATTEDIVAKPELVAQPKYAWKTALWFWKKRVQPVLKQQDAVAKGLFGYTVKVINGGLECPANEKANYRLAILKEIQAKWNLKTATPVLTGC